MPIFCWWFEPFFIFPYIGIKIIPTDFHSNIFQRGGEKPQTREDGILVGWLVGFHTS
jgi:hypothetical protein